MAGVTLTLFKQGMIWRVGNGESIDIWNDPWLPRGITRRVSTARRDVLINRVSDLINPNEGEWDAQLIHDTFHQDGVPIILSISVRQHMDDVVAWHFDAKGLFSVRSAYRVSVDNAATESMDQVLVALSTYQQWPISSHGGKFGQQRYQIK